MTFRIDGKVMELTDHERIEICDALNLMFDNHIKRITFSEDPGRTYFFGDTLDGKEFTIEFN